MGDFFRTHKWRLLASSLFLLLPLVACLLLWDRLPDIMTLHWGIDGQADHFGSKALVVFLPAGIMLAFQWLCILVTALDKGNRKQSPKAMGLVLWIIPLISLFIYGLMLSSTLGVTNMIGTWTFGLLGLMLLIMGNYMPKVSRNRTLGVKIYWTLANEENWNKTHRFTGKLWVGAGLVLLLSMLLPWMVRVPLLIAVLFLSILLPFLYSYRIYRKHRQAGIVYAMPPKSKMEKAALKITAVVVPLILAGCAILMLTGDIACTPGETALTVEATYWNDMTLEYEKMDSVQLHPEGVPGYRVMGFASARLLLGSFQSDELGAYTRYTYSGCKPCILIESQGSILVINEKTPEQTMELYQALLAHTS